MLILLREMSLRKFWNIDFGRLLEFAEGAFIVTIRDGSNGSCGVLLTHFTCQAVRRWMLRAYRYPPPLSYPHARLWVTVQSRVFIMSSLTKKPCDSGRQVVCDTSVVVFWFYPILYELRRYHSRCGGRPSHGDCSGEKRKGVICTFLCVRQGLFSMPRCLFPLERRVAGHNFANHRTTLLFFLPHLKR